MMVGSVEMKIRQKQQSHQQNGPIAVALGVNFGLPIAFLNPLWDRNAGVWGPDRLAKRQTLWCWGGRLSLSKPFGNCRYRKTWT